VPVITPHGLRHACATTLLRAGIPAHAVSRRLGHANPSITLKTYAHALPEDDRDAADIMGAVLGGNTAEAHNSRAIQASQTGTK